MKTNRRTLLGLTTIVGSLLAVSIYANCFVSAVFRIDPGQPYRLELGRGSGMAGLEIIRVTQDGTVLIHREKSGRNAEWEFATLHVSPEILAKILVSVESNHLLKMPKAYREPGANDGCQWIFLFQQGGHSKSVYFDNRFPAKIEQFAHDLDAIIANAGLATVKWEPVPPGQERGHASELWDSIK